MALNFPDAPVLDDVFTDAVTGLTYRWDGEKWFSSGKQAVLPPSIRPALTSIAPDYIGVSDGPTTLNLIGTDFDAASKVYIGTSQVTAAFVSATELTATFDPVDIGMGVHNVTVNNGGLSSIAKDLRIDPNPTATSMTPTTAVAGSAAFTLTVTGSFFTSNAIGLTTITWDGVPIPTNPPTLTTQITATVTPPAAAGTHEVSVMNGPVSASTPPLTFTVT